jgi:S1-C subfamily serine protease
MSAPLSLSPPARSVIVTRAVMEAVVLALVVVTPWAMGGVEPLAQLVLALGISLLLVLWLAVTVASGQFKWPACSVALCIAGITLLGFLQLIPMPTAVHRVLSPASLDLRQTLLPHQPELLTSDQVAPSAPDVWPLSVYPYATRIEAVRWLAIFFLFAVVRTQIAGAAALRRLCIAAAVNGAALALFGFAHSITAKSGRVYWNTETNGNVFGPFIYRNHYAAYTNLCLGLGLGLLMAAWPATRSKRDRHSGKQAYTETQQLSLAAFLGAPARAWTCLALALMLAGILVCLSRGGVAALAIGAAVTLLLRFRVKGGGPRRLRLVVLPAMFLVGLVIGLLVLLGVNPLETRLATLWTGAAFVDERWRIWLNTLAVATHFPVLGSGYGTLEYIEPFYRVQSLPREMGIIDQAHSDFLQAFAEGGILRLILTAALVAFTIRLGMRAMRRQTGRPAEALAFGGLFAIATLSVHALFEFVIPNPAIVFLAVVVAAHLAALAEGSSSPAVDDASASMLTARLGIPGRILVTTTVGTMAVVVVLQALQVERVHRLWFAAARSLRERPADYEGAANSLTAAVRTAPDNAVVRTDLGQLYIEAAQVALGRERHRVRTAAVLTGGSPLGGAGPLGAVVSLVAWPSAQEPASAVAEIFQRDVIPGLHELAKARGLCPLLPFPHVRFAAYASELTRADPPAVYFDRARRLLPFNPDLEYLAGAQHLREGHLAEAHLCWRRSLERSDRHFDEIMAAASTGGAAVGDAIPDNPELLLRAARRPDAAANGAARPLLERTLAVIAACPEPRSAAYSRFKAQALQLLGRDAEAAAAYTDALMLEPNQQEWRFEWITLLVQQEQWDTAADELRTLLARTNNREAEEMLKRVERERSIHREPGGGSGVPVTAANVPTADAVIRLAPAGQFAEGDSHFPRSSQWAALAATVRLVHPRTGDSGSGVVIGRDQNFVYVLTASHLVPEGSQGDEVNVQFYSPADWPKSAGPVRRATVRARAKDVDLAVLWVVGPETSGVLPLCPAAATKGQKLPLPVLTVGCDHGAPTAAVDQVRAVRFVATPYRGNFYETDHAQLLGRSGGPLVDVRGYLIGICSATRGGRGYYVATAEIHNALRQAGFDWLANVEPPGAR